MYIKPQEADKKNHEPKVWQKILQIHESKFNYEKELKRHFRNWQQDLPEKDPELDKRQQKLQKHLRKLMKKSVLSPGIKEYFPINEKFEIERSQDGKIKFVPSKKYEHYQVEYEAIRNSNDINALFNFTQTHPEHVDSLYYVGEFLRLQGNYRDSDGLIQRVIYIYQMAGSYDIMEFVKEDVLKKQIVYDVYSKSLFMAIFKFMDILGKKGCFRTALEYNKLLLKINTNDPTACLLCLDYNAISASQPQFLIDFVTYYSHYLGDKTKSLYLMPNFIYSLALAKFSLENRPSKNQSDMVVEQNNITDLILFTQQDWKQALELPSNQSFIKQSCRVLILRAIMVYPKLILDIAQKNQYTKQFLNHPKFEGFQKKGFKNIFEHQFWSMIPQSYSYHFLKLQSQNDSKGLDKVLQVYVERSKILWKSNDVMLWAEGALGFVLNQLQNKFDYQSFLENLCTEQCGGIPIPFPLSRYENVSKANFSDRVERIDLNNIQDNQDVQPQQNANRMNLQGNGFRLFLNSLLPWVNLPQNNQQHDPNQPQIEEDD